MTTDISVSPTGDLRECHITFCNDRNDLAVALALIASEFAMGSGKRNLQANKIMERKI